MTKTQFIASVQADANFKAWANTPAMIETAGTIQKWRGDAYIATPDGANIFAIWFIWDSVNDIADWQNGNQLSPDKNSNTTKLAALKTYLKGKYNAFFLGNIDLDNNWAQATVYTLTTGTLKKKDIIVFKQGANPITDLDVV